MDKSVGIAVSLLAACTVYLIWTSVMESYDNIFNSYQSEYEQYTFSQANKNTIDQTTEQYQNGIRTLKQLPVPDKIHIVDCSPINYSSKKELLNYIVKYTDGNTQTIEKLETAYKKAESNPLLQFCVWERTKDCNTETAVYLTRTVKIPKRNIYIAEEMIGYNSSCKHKGKVEKNVPTTAAGMS